MASHSGKRQGPLRDEWPGAPPLPALAKGGLVDVSVYATAFRGLGLISRRAVHQALFSAAYIVGPLKVQPELLRGTEELRQPHSHFSGKSPPFPPTGKGGGGTFSPRELPARILKETSIFLLTPVRRLRYIVLNKCILLI